MRNDSMEKSDRSSCRGMLEERVPAPKTRQVIQTAHATISRQGRLQKNKRGYSGDECSLHDDTDWKAPHNGEARM